MLESGLQYFFMLLRAYRHALQRCPADVLGHPPGQRRNAVLREQIRHEFAMRLGDELRQIFCGRIDLRIRRRHQDVQAIGPSLDMRIDPVEFLPQFFGREMGGTQYAQSAGFRRLDHHIPAVGKRKDRRFDAEHLACRAAHHGPPVAIVPAKPTASTATAARWSRRRGCTRTRIGVIGPSHHAMTPRLTGFALS